LEKPRSNSALKTFLKVFDNNNTLLGKPICCEVQKFLTNCNASRKLFLEKSFDNSPANSSRRFLGSADITLKKIFLDAVDTIFEKLTDLNLCGHLQDGLK
jgi:hypothetical protein